MKHRIDEKRESSCKYTSQERIRGYGGGGEFLKGVDEVVECCLEDCEEAEAH